MNTTKRPMTGPSRMDVARMIAYKALEDVFRKGAYSSLALNTRLKESSASVEDKRLATAIFYAAVENRLLIAFMLRSFAERLPDPVIEDILHIALAQLMFMDKLPDHAVVDEAVKMCRRLERDRQSGFVNAVLRSFLRAREAGTLPKCSEIASPVRRLSVTYSVPELLVARLMHAYGEEETEEMLRYKPDEHMESVRTNFRKMDPEQFRAYCARKRWNVRDGLLPGFAYVSGAGNLAGDPDYRSGMYSIQGIGAALAALAVQAAPGMQILDACSAPGGKSCLLAEKMQDTGRVYAWDVHAHRVELIRASAARLGLECIRPAQRDASEFRPDLEYSMDAVLVDAPCSGLGVIINKPDVKYNYNDANLDGLVQLQYSILSACARYVRHGGTLVYSTCTVLPEENSEQIKRFLDEHDDFVPDTNTAWLPESLRARADNGSIQLQAYKDNTEGFYIAKLRRL